VQPQTVEAVLVISADAISASRPGARGESLEHYIKRLESLEQLAASKPGVDKVYALQAGREIRVIVRPTEVDDDLAALLSHEIAREIEDQLEYPGQVKVTVIRESRSVDVARNHTNAQNGDTEPRALDAPIGGVPIDGVPIDDVPLDDVALEDIPIAGLADPGRLAPPSQSHERDDGRDAGDRTPADGRPRWFYVMLIPCIRYALTLLWQRSKRRVGAPRCANRPEGWPGRCSV